VVKVEKVLVIANTVYDSYYVLRTGLLEKGCGLLFVIYKQQVVNSEAPFLPRWPKPFAVLIAPTHKRMTKFSDLNKYRDGKVK